MRPLDAALVLCLIGCSAASASRATAVERAPAPAFRPGEVLVALQDRQDLDPLPDGVLRSRPSRLSQTLDRLGLHRYRRIGPDPRSSSDEWRWMMLRSDREDFDPAAAAAELRATGRFRAALPNYLMKLSITIPNDPYVLPEQWYIQSTSDADVDLPEAWDVERGDSAVVIGIADTGVDLGHPDLAGKIWTNPGEIPANGIDDDGNGYIDDVNGWDFGDDDNDPNPHPVFDAQLGIDVAFHGTFVAGIAAAATNNGMGIAGAGWRSRIMPLKVVDQAGEITTAALAGAFLYSAQQQADVLNLSLGQYAEPGLPEFLQQLVDHADSAGVICVSAAGNDADSARVYPAANDKVIAVGASDQSNFRTSFSNWGPWIDVAAPGTQMWSLINRNYAFDETTEIYYIFLFGWDGENPYMYGDGTSFACPLVAGTCALVRARYGLSPEQMQAHIVATGDAVAFDLPIGTKLNAHRAVTTSVDVPGGTQALGHVALSPGRPNPFHDRISLRFALATAGEAALDVVDVQGRTVRALARGTLAAGPHEVEWDGRSTDGRLMGGGVYFVRLRAGMARATRRIALIR